MAACDAVPAAFTPNVRIFCRKSVSEGGKMSGGRPIRRRVMVRKHITLHILTIVGMVALGFIAAAPACGFNPADMERLKTTNQCPGCDLSKANLADAKLAGANLSRAKLFEANLKDADLQGANCAGIDLYVANLSGANLSSANMKGARGVFHCISLYPTSVSFQ